MRLVSSFTRKNVVSAGNNASFLAEDALRNACPSIYASHPHESRSSRYLYIPTTAIVDGLAKEGFKPVFAAQSTPRKADRHGFTKHLIRFRRESDLLGRAGECPEVVALNSHGGESQLQMFGGLFRSICLNGCVAGEVVDEIRVRHTSGKLVDDAVAGATRIAAQFGKVMDQVDQWKQMILTPEQQLAFAAEASALRMPKREGETKLPIPATELLIPRRPQDRGQDLYSIFNVVQENIMRGGAEGSRQNALGRWRRFAARPINGIDQSVDLNRALWNLAATVAA